MNFEYRLEPNAEQAATFEAWLETCRRVWNYALAERKDWLNSRKSPVNACSIRKEFILPADAPWPNYARQCKALTEAKKHSPTLRAVNAQALQQVLQQLENAFLSMRERGLGFPRFKGIGRLRSLCFPQFATCPLRGTPVSPVGSTGETGGNALKLPAVGYVKLRLSRPIPEGFCIKQVRVLRRASGWYALIALQSEVELPSAQPQARCPNEPHGEALGIDLGLNHFAALSDGELIHRPRFFVDTQRKLKSLQRKVSRKVKGSNNRSKAQKKVTRHYERTRECRKDFHRKLAHHLCDKAGTVFAERLSIKALAASMLAKHVLDAGWGMFLSTLEWVCRKRGVYFAKVDAQGTSQTCPKCETHTGKKALGMRVHECPACGYTVDRDVAAAQVVRNRGIALGCYTGGAAVGQTVKKPVEAT